MRTTSIGTAMLWLALASAASGQSILPAQQKLTAADGATGALFGWAVAVDGDVALIGAASDSGVGSYAGAAYTFELQGGDWTQAQKLTAADAQPGDAFGRAVAVDGDRLVVGAWLVRTAGIAAGAAYVFHHDGVQWVEEQKLVPGDIAPQDSFGAAVAIAGDVIVIGAWGDDDGGDASGSAYVFRRQGGVWVEEQKLRASDGAANDNFGYAVAAEPSTLVIGAPYQSAQSKWHGAAYVFQHDGTSWIQRQKLVARDAAPQDILGFSVSLADDLLVAGAPGDDTMGNGAGAVYVFRRAGNDFVEEQKVTPLGLEAGDGFGFSVDGENDTVLSGAWFDDDAGFRAGAAYLHRHRGNVWVEEAKLQPDGLAFEDELGVSVALSGSVAVVGARGDDDLGYDAGAAYVRDVPDLALDPLPEVVAPGDWLAFNTGGGLPLGGVILFLIDVDGTPVFWQVARGRFDPFAPWQSPVWTVPPGLSGLTLRFQSFGQIAPGKVGASNPACVQFL